MFGGVYWIIGKKGSSMAKRKERKVALTAFVKSIAEMFSYDESVYYLNMVNFARKYYRQHYLQCEKYGLRIKSPSEWYEEFAVATQCREMKQLENRFFGLVKREISRQDAREYIAYFEAMAYQRERNYCL